MANPLTDIPEGEPSSLVAGDSWSWQRTDLVSDYPASAWSLAYLAILQDATGSKIEIDASASGDGFVIAVTADNTKNKTPGVYFWEAYATRTADAARIRVAKGSWKVEPNFALNSDTRSHARKMVTLVETEIERRMTNAAIDRYRILSDFERELFYMPYPTLMATRDRYKQELAKEIEARTGRSSRKISRVSFDDFPHFNPRWPFP